MKKFYLDILIVISASLLTVFAFALVLDYYGWSDYGYKRFTSAGSKSMILGTSRAAQSIQPSILNKEFEDSDFEIPFYNFSFTRSESPYGEVYFKAIKKKLDRNTTNALFILSVDPWSLSETNEVPNGLLIEQGTALDKIWLYTKPNLQYLIYFAPKPIVFETNMQLHDDGWLEVTVPMDSASVTERIKSKMQEYTDVILKRSENRIQWLVKTIEFLKRHGTVVLCRIPAHPFFISQEDLSWPSFDDEMKSLSRKNGVNYISFMNRIDDYKTVDGNHLYKKDGLRFTKDLSDSIKVRLNSKFKN